MAACTGIRIARSATTSVPAKSLLHLRAPASTTKCDGEQRSNIDRHFAEMGVTPTVIIVKTDGKSRQINPFLQVGSAAISSFVVPVEQASSCRSVVVSSPTITGRLTPTKFKPTAVAGYNGAHIV